MEREVRNFPVTEIRAIDGAKPIIEGHAAVFGVKSHDLGFREIIQPGAFSDAVMNDDVRFLLNHRGLPIARTKSGTLRLSEDARGLAFRAELDPGDPDVQRLVPKVKRGDLSEMSFAFGVRNRQEDEKWYKEGGEMVRSLLKVQLFDVSAVSFPAYPSTDLQSRAYYEQRMAEVDKTVDPAKQLADAEAAEKKKADFAAKMQAQKDFIDRRTPPPDPLSLSEIYKKARLKAV